jgi:hypothetical protein
MSRLCYRIGMAAICAALVGHPAQAQPRCPGYNPGEPGYLLHRELKEIWQRRQLIHRTEARQQCSVKMLAIFKEYEIAWQRVKDFMDKHVGGAECPRTGANATEVEHINHGLKATRQEVIKCQSVLGIVPSPANSPTNRTGASAPPPYPIDCKKRSIDANVAWYYTCNPPAESAELKRTAYRHPITPQQLYGKAYAACRSRPVEQQSACIPDAKKTVLLAEDSAIRARCGTLSGEQQVHCVERYYLFGPDAGSAQNVRAYVQQEIDYHNRVEAALRQQYFQTEDEINRLGTEHPRFVELANKSYALSLANAGTGPVPPEVEQLAQTITLDPLTTQQALFDRVVRASVDIAIEANKSRLSEKEQKNCATAAYKAAWAVMSGLPALKVDPKCEQVISDAVAQLAYQAANQFTANTPPEEDLLKHYLALHYANTKGKNDGTLDAPFEAKGLTPDEEMRKEGEQLLKKSE